MDDVERRIERLERVVVLLAGGVRLSDADAFPDAGPPAAPVADLCALIDDIRGSVTTR